MSLPVHSTPANSTSYAVGLESRRKSRQRSYSSVSPIAGGGREDAPGAQEAAVGLVLPGHRAVALPAVAAQQVQAAVVADPGIGVDGQRVGAGIGGPASASAAQATATGMPAYGVAGRESSVQLGCAGSRGGGWAGGRP